MAQQTFGMTKEQAAFVVNMGNASAGKIFRAMVAVQYGFAVPKLSESERLVFESITGSSFESAVPKRERKKKETERVIHPNYVPLFDDEMPEELNGVEPEYLEVGDAKDDDLPFTDDYSQEVEKQEPLKRAAPVKKKNYKEQFERFWQAYPRKMSKDVAYKSYCKIAPGDELAEKILKALEVQKQTDQWTHDNGKYIPYASTWLNQKRWEDELTVGAVQNAAISDEERREECIKWLMKFFNTSRDTAEFYVETEEYGDWRDFNVTTHKFERNR